MEEMDDSDSFSPSSPGEPEEAAAERMIHEPETDDPGTVEHAAGDDEPDARPDADAPYIINEIDDETAAKQMIHEPESDDPGTPEDEDDPEDGEDDPDDGPELPLESIVEAVLFASREALNLKQLARAAGKRVRRDAVREAIEKLNLHYLETGRAFEIAEISRRYQLMSRPEYVAHIARVVPKRETGEKDKTHKLSPSALDTLSIVAYKQPVTRAEIERIRGVGCGPALKALIERGSVKVTGKRADLVGHPLTYGTTDAFLVEFGLGSLDELPLRNEFLSMYPEPPPADPGEDDDSPNGPEDAAGTGEDADV